MAVQTRSAARSGQRPVVQQQPAELAVEGDRQVPQPPGVQSLGAALDRADEVAAHAGLLGQLLLPEVTQRALGADPAADVPPEAPLAVELLIGVDAPRER